MPTEEKYELKGDRVEEVLKDCLYRDEELDDPEHLTKETMPEGTVFVEGIMSTFAFNPKRLEDNKAEIKQMLRRLPMEFRSIASGGSGGWTFLNACDDRDGHQWTGLHLRMDQLFSLGQAIGVVECVLPRPMWAALPGGMPYYVVND